MIAHWLYKLPYTIFCELVEEGWDEIKYVHPEAHKFPSAVISWRKLTNEVAVVDPYDWQIEIFVLGKSLTNRKDGG